jgi:hypothetical protein
VNAGLTARPRPALSTRTRGPYASRIGERQAEGDETTERVTDERRSSYVQGVDERGDESLEEGGGVVGGGSGAVRGSGQVRSENPVSSCQGLSSMLALEAVMNSIRNGLVMRKAGDRGGAGQPKNPYFNAMRF